MLPPPGPLRFLLLAPATDANRTRRASASHRCFFHATKQEEKDVNLTEVVKSNYNMTTTNKEGYTMTGAISIRPSKDLRNNYAQISALAKENPVAITVNGREDTVVLNHAYFVAEQNYISEIEAKLAVYSHLAQAADDLKLGRVQSLDDAFDDILSELDGLEQ